MNGAGMWLAVAAAGGLGAVARFLVDLAVCRVGTDLSRLATMVVNVTGSLLAGLAAGSAISGHLGVEVEIVVAGGFLGAYTTFSTAMFQAVTVLEERRPIAAIGNLVATLVLAVVAAWCGMMIAN